MQQCYVNIKYAIKMHLPLFLFYRYYLRKARQMDQTMYTNNDQN